MQRDIAHIDISNMTDEEIDEFYRPKKGNKRKSLAPLYVYIILVQFSTPENHLSQQQIIELLERLYEITIERKALSRILHTLADEEIGVINTLKEGSWFECQKTGKEK